MPGPIGSRGSGHWGLDPVPVQVTLVTTCSPGVKSFTRVSLEGAQSRLDQSRWLSSEYT